MAKKEYTKLFIDRTGFKPEMGILVGSKTAVKINIDEVTVEDYKQGFGTDSSNDFQNLSFD